VIKAGEYFEALYLLLTFIAILRVALAEIKTNDCVIRLKFAVMAQLFYQ
jgi:hypothetical protein